MTDPRRVAGIVATSTLSRARLAVSVAFAAQGFGFAAMLTSEPGFKERFGVNDLAITLVILGVCVLAGLGSATAEALAHRWGSARALAVGLAVAAVGVGTAALAPDRVLFFAGFGVYGWALGQVDAGTNMQAVALQHRYGRSILTSFYAAWSAGGILGALVVSAHVAAGIPQQEALPVVPVVALVAAAVVRRHGWRDITQEETAPTVVAPADPRPFVIPWSGILVLGLAIVGYYVADTAVSTWSSIYLRDTLTAAGAVAPLGYAAYLGSTLLSRLGGDLLVRRRGRVVVVRLSGALGAVGLLGVVVAGSPAVAIVGLAVAGLGLGVVAPLCFAAAGALAPGQADAVIARLNIFNYVGAVVGGVFVGAIGTGSSLRIGFLLPVVLAVVVVIVAPGFGDKVPRSRDARVVEA
ncbi:inner membrane protein YbjJ [mine drainage metagenome]|uniref:Inner membrane protein YbjJ n=1 Tax=mine drainage metagenome TaxID=410659 RepID=A0A1J5QJ63_9ZZZZ